VNRWHARFAGANARTRRQAYRSNAVSRADGALRQVYHGETTYCYRCPTNRSRRQRSMATKRHVPSRMTSNAATCPNEGRQLKLSQHACRSPVVRGEPFGNRSNTEPVHQQCRTRHRPPVAGDRRTGRVFQQEKCNQAREQNAPKPSRSLASARFVHVLACDTKCYTLPPEGADGKRQKTE